MLRWIPILVIASLAPAFSKDSTHYADVDRLLSIERWYQEECRVWIVQRSRMLVYDSSGASRRLLFSRPLTPAEQSGILSALSSIPKDAFGFHYAGGYSTHPPLIRLHFTKQGRWTDDRIEVSGFTPKWLASLLASVSTLCGKESHVDYPDIVMRYRSRLDEPHQIEVRKIAISVFYEQSKPWWAFWR